MAAELPPKEHPTPPGTPLYARHLLLPPLLSLRPSSNASNLCTNSSCSFSFVSTLMARRRTFKTCEATAATALSWRPASTSSARSESLRLISESSACGRPRPARLPPRAAACLRASALAGSCHQQKVCGGSTLTVHGELSRLVPRQRFISLGPPPLPRGKQALSRTTGAARSVRSAPPGRRGSPRRACRRLLGRCVPARPA